MNTFMSAPHGEGFWIPAGNAAVFPAVVSKVRSQSREHQIIHEAPHARWVMNTKSTGNQQHKAIISYEGRVAYTL